MEIRLLVHRFPAKSTSCLMLRVPDYMGGGGFPGQSRQVNVDSESKLSVSEQSADELCGVNTLLYS